MTIKTYGRKGPDWLKTDLILSFFPAEDSRKAYREKVQSYAGEEKWLWEEFRHSVVIGTLQFVDRIKARYISEKPHPEFPQQKGLVGRLDIRMFLEKASQLLDFDVDRFQGSGRLYGEDKAKRNILALWNTNPSTGKKTRRRSGLCQAPLKTTMRNLYNCDSFLLW